MSDALTSRARVRSFLSGDLLDLAGRVVTENPWLFVQLGVDLQSWSKAFLNGVGLSSASLHVVGSASVGFSLSPEKAGRPFRRVGGMNPPSDIDLAVIDKKLFTECWNEMLHHERLGQPRYLHDSDRIHVYWGRVDDRRVPHRASSRRLMRTLTDSVRRSAECRGYPMSIRVYRREEDLTYYLVDRLRHLRSEIGP